MIEKRQKVLSHLFFSPLDELEDEGISASWSTSMDMLRGLDFQKVKQENQILTKLFGNRRLRSTFSSILYYCSFTLVLKTNVTTAEYWELLLNQQELKSESFEFLKLFSNLGALKNEMQDCFIKVLFPKLNLTLGVSICLNRVSIETLDLDTGREPGLVSTIEKS